MATVSSSLKLFDAMSGPLKNITQGMNMMVSTMQRMQSATNKNMSVDKSLIAAKQRISSAEAEINRQIQASQKNQNGFNQSVKNTHSSMFRLGAAVVVVNQGVELLRKGWDLVRSGMNVSDNMTAANARLAMINDGTRTRIELEKEVLGIANRTRASYEATAGLITKVGAGTQGVFKDNNSLLKFAESFNKSLVVSGATAVESESAILQMSQALGSGVLQGDELRSLSETAPALMRILADGLGVARGQLKKMGADGELTSDKIVSAFKNQQSRIDEMFKTMPMTFGGAMVQMSNRFKTWFVTLNQAGGPLQNITDQVVSLVDYLNSANGQAFFDGLAQGISTAVDWLMELIQIITEVYTFFSANWSTIEPIIWGLVGAITAWNLIAIGFNTVLGIQNGLMAISAANAAFASGMTLAQAAATTTATGAQVGLNAALLASPLTWVILAIVAVVAAIYFLVRWLIDLWKTNDKFAAGLMRAWNGILNFFDQVPIFFVQVGNGIVNAFQWAKVETMNIVQSMADGVVNIINGLISMLNKIPGVSITAMNHLEVTGNVAAEAEAIRQAGENKVAGMQANAVGKAQAREQKVQKMLNSRADQRSIDEAIERDKLDKERKLGAPGEKIVGALFDPTSPAIAAKDDKKKKNIGTVDKIKGKVDISSEDLKVMRDLAEMKNIQNFVTLTPTVQVKTGPITNGDNLDSIVSKITTHLQDSVASSAKGVFANG
ncbi:hypothetical protein PMSD_26040 [Paenibacillus macquariensis subsp. defensor]|nr:hypothetical protein PMSD_26040 [Paenibacillus macquariensis subsp. defensor]